MTPTAPDSTKNWLRAIRQDWDARARQDARAYINWPDVPNEEGAFFESGRFDYKRYVVPFLRKMQFDPQGKTALEIGCGIGRIGRWMSQDFSQYIGVDVSPEMVDRARGYGFPRARFEAVSGGDLAGIDDARVDFVFSFAVFQHVPDEGAIFSYFTETARVLRPGGVFRLHMKGLRPWAVGRWQIEAGFSNNRRLVNAGFTKVPMMRVRYLDTWQGRSIPPGKAIAKCNSLSLEVLDVAGAWTTMMWVGGRKK
ncbi:MAG: class I SAM-dependent methyltransferase [Candidatus Acidiferrales bacterium]